MLTAHQKAQKIERMKTAALAVEALGALQPDEVVAAVEAHFVGRGDISPEAIEAMSNRMRRVAWARERGEL